MAQLIKSYPTDPKKNRIVWTGEKETLIAHLNDIEARVKRERLSVCGTVFIEFKRIDDFTLDTCIYKYMVTGEVVSIFVNYAVFPKFQQKKI